MDSLDCDVLVIGGGLAGSSAARATAKAGLKTICIEKKPEIGYPVKCGECFTSYFLTYLPYKIPKEQLIWKLNGVQLSSEGQTIRRTGALWSDYAVNRRNFDKFVWSQAEKAGATIMMETELTEFQLGDKQTVEKAIVKTGNKETIIKPKIVIGADGYDSTTLKLLGEYKPIKGGLGEIHEWEMHNLSIPNPDFLQVYFGDMSDVGYAYVFPRGKTSANVGVGCTSLNKPIEEYFNEFMAVPEIMAQTKNGLKIESKGGKINPRRISDKWVYGNVILAGDSAGQNIKPFVEGILPAIIFGDLAGKSAAASIKKQQPIDYYQRAYRKMGDILNLSDEAEEIAYDLFDMGDKKKYLLLLLFAVDTATWHRIPELKKKDYEELTQIIKQWENPRKETIPKIQERLWLEYQKIKVSINKVLE